MMHLPKMPRHTRLTSDNLKFRGKGKECVIIFICKKEHNMIKDCGACNINVNELKATIDEH